MRNNYRKVPKFSDARTKIQTKRPNIKVFCQNDANVIANSEDPDQTAPQEQSDLGLHCSHRPMSENLGSLCTMKN